LNFRKEVAKPSLRKVPLLATFTCKRNFLAQVSLYLDSKNVLNEDLVGVFVYNII
jgi:hypothetical protein